MLEKNVVHVSEFTALLTNSAKIAKNNSGDLKSLSLFISKINGNEQNRKGKDGEGPSTSLSLLLRVSWENSAWKPGSGRYFDASS